MALSIHNNCASTRHISFRENFVKWFQHTIFNHINQVANVASLLIGVAIFLSQIKPSHGMHSIMVRSTLPYLAPSNLSFQIRSNGIL